MNVRLEKRARAYPGIPAALNAKGHRGLVLDDTCIESQKCKHIFRNCYFLQMIPIRAPASISRTVDELGNSKRRRLVFTSRYARFTNFVFVFHKFCFVLVAGVEASRSEGAAAATGGVKFFASIESAKLPFKYGDDSDDEEAVQADVGDLQLEETKYVPGYVRGKSWITFVHFYLSACPLRVKVTMADQTSLQPPGLIIFFIHFHPL